MVALETTEGVLPLNGNDSTLTPVFKIGDVAQLGERQLCKLDVASSILVRSTMFLLRGREVATRQAHNLKIGGANPSPATKLCGSGREAQYKSLQNSKAVGSNPTFHSKFAPSLCTY